MTRIGIIGVGGFAATHHQAVKALEVTGEFRLVCTCDPNAAALEAAALQGNWSERGVKSYSNHEEMIAAHQHELDIVTVPTPIPLHAEMHRACVDAGIACYLEKPPTLDPDELERMIAVDAGAKHATQVGFNFIVEEPRQALKSRLLSGEFGKLLRVTFVGMWPRPTSYFTRNNWAGVLRSKDGRLLLDSCIANAMAHYIHNLLFWAGADGILSYAEPTRVDAELYRAHAIETFDTCFVRGTCAGDVRLCIASTHACNGSHTHREVIECESATIHYVTGGDYQITDKNGTLIEQGKTDKRPLLEENFRAYAAYVHGDAARPLTLLTDSRPFVHLNDLVYVAADAISSVDKQYISNSDGDYLVIERVREACEEFARNGAFPTEQGIVWGKMSGDTAYPADISRLRAIVESL